MKRKITKRLRDEQGIAVYVIMCSFLVVGAVFMSLIADRGKFQTEQSEFKYALGDSLDVAVQQINQTYFAHGVVDFNDGLSETTFLNEFCSDLDLNRNSVQLTNGPGNEIDFKIYPNQGNTLLPPVSNPNSFVSGTFTPYSYNDILAGGVTDQLPQNISINGSNTVSKPSIMVTLNIPVLPPISFQGQVPYFEHEYLMMTAVQGTGGGPGTGSGSLNWTELNYDSSWWTPDINNGLVGSRSGWPDPNAELLWPIQESNVVGYKAPDGPTYHRRVFNLPYSESLKIYFTVDDQCAIYIDGQLIQPLTGTAGQVFSVNTPVLSAGQHVLAVEAINGPYDIGQGNTTNPGIFAMAVYNASGQFLFDTQADGSWVTSGYQTP